MDKNPTKLQTIARYIPYLWRIHNLKGIYKTDNKPLSFKYGIIGVIRNLFKGRIVKFIGFEEGWKAAIFEDWR